MSETSPDLREQIASHLMEAWPWGIRLNAEGNADKLHAIGDVVMAVVQPELDRRAKAADDWAASIALAAGDDLARRDAEIARLRELTATCTCGTPGLDYNGPDAECPVHGAIRGMQEAHAEIEQLHKELAEKSAEVDDKSEVGHMVVGAWMKRAEQAEARIARIRRMAQVWIDMRPDYPTATREGHGIAYAGEQIVAVIDEPKEGDG